MSAFLSVTSNRKAAPIMTRKADPTPQQQAVQLLADQGVDGMLEAMKLILNQAMRLQRQQALGAEPYERTDQRRGHANGFKPRTLDTRLGRIVVDVPQVRGPAVKFYPDTILERGLRSERALRLAVAEMYVRGVSTRKVQYVMERICGLDVTSAQVSRASAMLDEELGRWRERPLGRVRYLILDARYEKVRYADGVRSCALLLAIGVREDGCKSILGLSVSCSEAEAHWRGFLLGLVRRGLHGVHFVVSDDHPGLKAALATCLPQALWQRCQFHLMQNAMQYVPRKDRRKEVAAELRRVFDAPDEPEARRRLLLACAKYAGCWPRLASWLEGAIPEGLAVFALPPAHRTRLRTTNPLERLNKEIKRRTYVVGIFPHEHSLLRLATAVAVEFSEAWEAGVVFVDMNLIEEEVA